MPRDRLPRIMKHYSPDWHKESWQTSEETSRYVRPERVNRWPNCMTDIWWWWWWWWWWFLQKCFSSYWTIFRHMYLFVIVVRPVYTIIFAIWVLIISLVYNYHILFYFCYVSIKHNSVRQNLDSSVFYTMLSPTYLGHNSTIIREIQW